MKDIFEENHAVVMTLPYEDGVYSYFVKPGVVPGRIDTDVRATKKYQRESFDDAVDMARQVRALVPSELKFLCELYAGEAPYERDARKSFTDAFNRVKFEVVMISPVRCSGEY